MIWGSSAQDGSPEYYYFGLIRKYVIVFGRTFSDIIIQRTVGPISNTVTQDIKVPLQYAAKDKMIQIISEDPDLDRPFSVNLPRMSFEITGYEYDASRKITSLVKNTVRNASNVNSFLVQYAPIPYNISFDLHIYSKNQEDTAKITEQVLPFFVPDYTPTVELIPEMNETRPIPIEYVSPVGYLDLYDGKQADRRILVYTMHFRMRAFFFGPVRPKPMIKFGTINQRIGIWTNNAITINYNNANGPFGVNTAVFSYFSNGAIQATGIIDARTYANSSTGTLIIKTTNGSFTNTTSFYSQGNSVVATVSPNGFFNGIITSNGDLIPNPGIAEYQIAQPGLTANGYPTTFVNNSISYTLIDVNDDYGYAQQVNSAEVT